MVWSESWAAHFVLHGHVERLGLSASTAFGFIEGNNKLSAMASLRSSALASVFLNLLQLSFVLGQQGKPTSLCAELIVPKGYPCDEIIVRLLCHETLYWKNQKECSAIHLVAISFVRYWRPVKRLTELTTDDTGWIEQVETADGFLLGLQHIPHGVAAPSGPAGPAVLLLHGLSAVRFLYSKVLRKLRKNFIPGTSENSELSVLYRRSTSEMRLLLLFSSKL